MVYITVRQSPIYHQMTLEEYLFQNYQTPPVVNANIANTRTYEVENVSEHFSSKIGVEALIGNSCDLITIQQSFVQRNGASCMRHFTSQRNLAAFVESMRQRQS